MSANIHDVIVLGDSSDEEDSSNRSPVYPVPTQLLRNTSTMPIKMEIVEEQPCTRHCDVQPSQVTVQQFRIRENNTHGDTGDQPSGSAARTYATEADWTKTFTIKREPGNLQPAACQKNSSVDQTPAKTQLLTSFNLSRDSDQQSQACQSQQPATVCSSSNLLPTNNIPSTSRVDMKPLFYPMPQGVYMNNYSGNYQRPTAFQPPGSIQGGVQEKDQSAVTWTAGDTIVSSGEKIVSSSTLSDSRALSPENMDRGEPISTSAKEMQSSDSNSESSDGDESRRPPSQKIRCERCCGEFVSESVYENHLEKCDSGVGNVDNNQQSPNALYKKSGSYYQCKRCRFRSHHKETVINHVRDEHSGVDPETSPNKSSPKGKFRCTICNKEFDTYRLLTSHKAFAHGSASAGFPRISKFKDIKSKDQSKENNTQTSNDSEETQGLFKCKLCPFEASVKLAKRHANVHNLEKQFPCSICNRPFSRRIDLKSHYAKHHNVKENKIVKRKRGRPLKAKAHAQTKPNLMTQGRTTSNLMAHGRTKTNLMTKAAKKPKGKFSCETCGYSTFLVHNYYRHLETLRHKRNTSGQNTMDPQASLHSDNTKETSDRLDLFTNTKDAKLKSPSASATAKERNQQEDPPSTSVQLHNKEAASHKIARESTEPRLISSPCDKVEAQPHGEKSFKDGRQEVTLESDLMKFRQRPFACSLCFFRTGNMVALQQHVHNHLTGGSQEKQEMPVTRDITVSPDSQTHVNSSQSHGKLRFPDTSQISLQQQPINTLPFQQTFKMVKSPETSKIASSIPVHHNHHRQKSAESLSTNMAQHMHYSQSNSLIPVSNPRFEARNTPYCPFPPGSNQSTSPSLQIQTEDLLDVGDDFTKDPRQFEPYMCLYDRRRFRNLASVINHFEIVHSDMLRLKSKQSRMRTEAAMLARAQVEPNVVVKCETIAD